MNIKTELIKSFILDGIFDDVMDFVIDENEIVDTKAVIILEEIQEILKNREENDSRIVEEIVDVFKRYNLDTGECYNF